MKKTFLIIILSLFFLPSPTHAQTSCNFPDAGTCFANGCTWNGTSCEVTVSQNQTGVFSMYTDEFNQAIGITNRDLSTPAGIINAVFPYLFILAGLILFAMLVMGGFNLLTSAANPKAAEAGKQRITMALVGFLIVFTSYWLVQIIEIIFGINILGN